MKALNPYREQLLAAFAKTVPKTGTAAVFFRHPSAPTLLLSRDPATLPQVVPVLVAGSLTGGLAANTQLGVALSLAGDEQIPLFQGISDGAGFHAVMAPYLFYRAPENGCFSAAVKNACQEAAEEGLLTDWCVVRCGISYLTKDGKNHRAEDYPEAFDAERL